MVSKIPVFNTSQILAYYVRTANGKPSLPLGGEGVALATDEGVLPVRIQPLTCVNMAHSRQIGTSHKRIYRERPVCRSAELQRNQKTTPHEVFHKVQQKTERHMGRSLQGGVMVVLFMVLHFLCSMCSRCLCYVLSIFIRCRRRVSGTGNPLAGCLPGRPELQHVAGCIKISTRLNGTPKIPLIESSWGS